MNIIGVRTLSEVRANIIPPLWIWIRLVCFLLGGATLHIFEFEEYARILFVLSIVSFISASFAAVFKAIANGINRYFKS